MRIVLPFDGSPSAGRALEHLVALFERAGKDGTEIHVINVQPLVTPLSETFARDAADVASRLTASAMDQGAKLLSTAVERLERAGIAPKSAVLLGDPAPTIASYVRDHRADAVIMGTRGLGAVGAIVLGSVASKVVHLVKVPVTLVH